MMSIREGIGARPRIWWDVAFTGEARAMPMRWANSLLADGDAVRARMVADVPLGAFVCRAESTAARVVALMAEDSGRAVETWFDRVRAERTGRERYATQVAQRFATNHSART
jgi:asparagine synthase (glutamine-hydrolysing)